jgi:hypothetical protein
MLRTKHALTALVILGACVMGAVGAQQPPAAEELAAALGFELPRGWTVASFEIEATSDYGTPVEPDIRNRFVAVVELAHDTFLVVERDGPYTFVRPIAEAGEQRTIYGISASVRSAGTWRTRFTLEHDPTADTGEPSGLISGRVIVLGSEEEARHRELLAAEEDARHRGELARRRRDEELKAQDREAEAAQLAHEARLQALAREVEHATRLVESRYQAALAEERGRAELAREAHDEQLRDQAHAQHLQQIARETERMRALGDGLSSEIEPHLHVQLPGQWTIDTLRIVEVASSGSYEAPSFRYRFEADVLLTRDTFVLEREDGAVSWVRPAASGGEARTLYGVATASRDGDAWVVEVTIDDRAGLDVGRPLDSFPMRVIALGSAEANAYRERLETEAAEAHEAEMRRRAREEEQRAQERQAELERQRSEAQRRDDQRAREAAEQERLRTERAAALSDLRAAFADDDPVTHRLALAAALEHDDPHLHAQALWEVMSRRGTWSGTLFDGVADNLRGDPRFAFGVAVKEFDDATGDFSGSFQGGIFAPSALEEPLQGNLSDGTLSITNSGCALSAVLEVQGSAAALVGELQCRELRPTTWGFSVAGTRPGRFRVLMPVIGTPPFPATAGE